MPTPLTHNEKPAAATIRDRFNFMSLTTKPLNKEQVHVSYHISCALFKPR